MDTKVPVTDESLNDRFIVAINIKIISSPQIIQSSRRVILLMVQWTLSAIYESV